MISTQVILYHNVTPKNLRTLGEFDTMTIGQIDNLLIWELDEGNSYGQKNPDFVINLQHDLNKVIIELKH